MTDLSAEVARLLGDGPYYNPDRDVIGQGNHYMRHVMAMTGERLHSKSDIAQELAHRDQIIERLDARVREQATELEALRRDAVCPGPFTDIYDQAMREGGPEKAREMYSRLAGIRHSRKEGCACQWTCDSDGENDEVVSLCMAHYEHVQKHHLSPPGTVEVSRQAIDTRVRDLERQLAAKQARIDALMIEHCPDEMTPEQRDEWARHQTSVVRKGLRPVSFDEDRADTIGQNGNEGLHYVEADAGPTPLRGRITRRSE